MSWRELVVIGGPGSPAVSATLACSGAIVVVYVAQWTARAMADPAQAMAAILVASGLGMTLGPYLVRRARGDLLPTARLLLTARFALLGGMLAVVAFLGSSHAARFIVMLGLMAGLTAMISASTVVQATARQLRYTGHHLAQIVGWSHSAHAGGTLIGVWSGLALETQRAPTAGILLSSAVLVLALRHVNKAPTEHAD